jgi:hypothetical protein
MCLLRHLKVVGKVAKDSGTEVDLWATDHGNGILMWVLLPSLCSLSVAAAGRKFSIVIVILAHLVSHSVAAEMQRMHVVCEVGSRKIVKWWIDSVKVGQRGGDQGALSFSPSHPLLTSVRIENRSRDNWKSAYL